MSHVTIDSTESQIAALEEVLYGTTTTDPRLPSGLELVSILEW